VTVRILVGDALAMLKTLDAESVQCCVTSPPYWGLRDYGVAGQFGLEKTPDEYVERMVEVFSAVRGALRKDGTLWLNIGDSYVASPRGNAPGDYSTSSLTNPKRQDGLARGQVETHGSSDGAVGRAARADRRFRSHDLMLKPKDLVGIPWMLAFALRADGWYLRSDNIWSKPNPMPESVTDRPTKAHEYVFLLSKSGRYYYDGDAIAEPVTLSTVERVSQPTLEQQEGSARVPGKTNGNMKAVLKRSGNKVRRLADGTVGDRPADHMGRSIPWEGATRNKRSVWEITTQPFKESHFATMPPELAETCIKAGSAEGQTVLDPFGGAGTTGLVADRLSRNALLIELNPAYATMAADRIRNDNPMFAEVHVA
jgi:DNA modification methylase